MASSFPIPVRALVFSVAATLGSGFVNGPALAGASGPFLAHQALYELKLVKARGPGRKSKLNHGTSKARRHPAASRVRKSARDSAGRSRTTILQRVLGLSP